MARATPIIATTDHDFLVPSDTTAGVRYRTTRFSCDCRGFSKHGGAPGWTCRHVRRVRAEFGMPLIKFPQRPAAPMSDPKEAA